jgi:hypothetical protein
MSSATTDRAVRAVRAGRVGRLGEPREVRANTQTPRSWLVTSRHRQDASISGHVAGTRGGTAGDSGTATR